MTDFQEGDEVRSGMAVVDVVDPSQMRVRIRVCQADAGAIAPGQPARVALDAYPGLSFDGRVETVAPLAVPSQLTAKVRGPSWCWCPSPAPTPVSMPDLSAAADIVVEQLDNVLILPRESVALEPEGAWVLLQRGRSFERQPVTVDDRRRPAGRDRLRADRWRHRGPPSARRVLTCCARSRVADGARRAPSSSCCSWPAPAWLPSAGGRRRFCRLPR